MSAIEDLVDRYAEGWSHPSAEERGRCLRATLTDDVTYCDPQADCRSRAELEQHIAAVHAAMPGVVVRRTSAVDVHHARHARFGWRATLPDGSGLPESLDAIELTEDGSRIRRIVGFFGALRPL